LEFVPWQQSRLSGGYGRTVEEARAKAVEDEEDVAEAFVVPADDPAAVTLPGRRSA
jgi:hypothetical protein